MEEAENQAMDSCIKQGVLKDLLINSGSEVLHMLLTEYDAKKHLKSTYEEGMKSGHAEGLQQGRKQMIMLNQKLLEEGRLEYLIRAATDDAYREKLLQEYGLLDMRR